MEILLLTITTTITTALILIALGLHKAKSHIRLVGKTESLERFEKYIDFRMYWIQCDYIRRVHKIFKVDYNKNSTGFGFLKRYKDIDDEKVRLYFIKQRIYNGTLFRF